MTHSFLDRISEPNDLKALDKSDLPAVCEEIRALIIDTVSKNGGHLAPSLGVVELTAALHYVFDSPRDKIVWDVGHQAYAHKILTGRRKSFGTLRKLGGISGFPKIAESIHDAFGAGHSSNSISAALGMAHAMRRDGVDNRSIAVIGDGSMTGGLSFEALNHAGHKIGNLIVVLNDNEMSITPSVGALSRFLSRSIHGKTGIHLRSWLKKLLHTIPVLGKRMIYLAQKAEETTVSFLTPGFLFEAFGFDYIGPLDGHNLEEMLEVFNDVNAAQIGEKPVLIHVLTKKGKGYRPAEENPTRFHGIGPFDRETGASPSSGGLNYTKAFGDALVEIAKDNRRVIAITAAMMTGTGLSKFAERFPNRFFDVGMAEGHAVTFAAGLATQGYRPVVAIYSTFLQRSYDQIVHDVCLQNLPVTFAIDRAGVVGDDGATHHGAFDMTYMRSIPNMSIAAPRDEKLMKGMLSLAIKSDGPFAIRYPRGNVPQSNFVERPQPLEFGSAEIVFWSRKPVAIIWAVGHLVFEAVEAANRLASEGVDVVVVDPRFVRPFDVNLFKELTKECHKVITVEENALAGGFGSMVGELIVKQNLKNVDLVSLGLPDRFVEHGPQGELRKKCGIDASGIVKAVNEFVAVESSRTKRELSLLTGTSVSEVEEINVCDADVGKGS